MKKEFYRSYLSYTMYPVTIHCEGMEYKGATVLSAGFAAFGCDIHRVSAFVTLKNGTPELAKELLEILNQDGNFIRCENGKSFIYNQWIS